MRETDFDKKSQDFLVWFKNLPGATFHDHISIVDLRARNAGRGIVTTADIEPDTVLFTIPRQHIIYPANSELARKLPAVFAGVGGSGPTPDVDDDDGRAQDSWTSLILVMIHEHLRGSASPWRPYLDVLPARFETPMFWSAAELAELQASPVVASVGRAEGDAMIRSRILPVIRENEALFFGAGGAAMGDEELVELAHRMGSTIMAYAFDLERDDDAMDEDDAEGDGWVEDRDGRTVMGMVPMADILNADAEFNVCPCPFSCRVFTSRLDLSFSNSAANPARQAHINHSEEALVAISLRKIPAGEEILNYYGPLPNGQLCRRYGYTTSKHSRYDVAEVAWEPILDGVLSRVKMTRDEWRKLEAHPKAGEAGSDDDGDNSEGDGDTYVLERDCEDPDELGQLQGSPRFAQLPDELTERLKAVLKAAKKARPEAVPDKKARDDLMLGAVRDAIDAKLREYGTSLEEDAATLAGLGGGASARVRMALEVRIGEKRLLREARAWLDRKLGGDGQGERMELDAPSAKRQRRA
ncbi:hypothetical protein RB601_008600 [Gaeumannomyces tritici]